MSEPAVTTGLVALPRAAGGRAESLVLRVIALGFLPGSVVFGLLGYGAVAAQWTAFPVAWNIAAIIAVLLPPLVLGALSFLVSVHALRLIAVASVVGTLLAEMTAPLAVLPTAHLTSSAWIQQDDALGVVAAAVAWRPLGAVAVTVLISVFTLVDRIALTGAVHTVVAVQEALYFLLFCSSFIALAAISLSRGRDVDDSEAEALAAATTLAANAARDRERSRINALVHDRVLATLLAAARGGAETAELRRADANRALRDLRALLDADGRSGVMTGTEVIVALRSATTETAPDAEFGYEIGDEEVEPVSYEVVDALTGAVEEALRNALRHAGSVASIAVHVRADGDGLWVDVLDDGAGFEPARVPPTRLGIAESIRGRMAAIDGGDAQVISEVGIGTRVVLRYRSREAAGAAA